MVPCLRIEKEDGSSEWMYESKDIIAYLDERYGIHA
jgi:glutathione S-transferase